MSLSTPRKFKPLPTEEAIAIWDLLTAIQARLAYVSLTHLQPAYAENHRVMQLLERTCTSLTNLRYALETREVEEALSRRESRNA